MNRDLLIQRLDSAPDRLLRLCAGLSPEDARQWPKEGEWSVTEVVRHLVEGDRDTFLPRLQQMLTEDRPVFESRDRERRDQSDLQVLLGAFELARREVVRILRELDPLSWTREGVSPSRGPVTVEAYALTMADHDDEHLAQIDATKIAIELGKWDDS
jgi:uncharacterized damage-inducible protein DinB